MTGQIVNANFRSAMLNVMFMVMILAGLNTVGTNVATTSVWNGTKSMKMKKATLNGSEVTVLSEGRVNLPPKRKFKMALPIPTQFLWTLG